MFDRRKVFGFSSGLNSNSFAHQSRKQSWQRRALRHLVVEQLEDRRVLAAPHPLALGFLNGTNGFRLDGIVAGDFSGRSVASAGDVNGDGFDDVIIGAYKANDANNHRGESYVVFGKSNGFSSAIELSALDGNNGFRLRGLSATDYSGYSVAGAGDINGDGYDDLIIGAGDADTDDPTVLRAGESYVVFGKSSGFASSINLGGLSSSDGFRIEGIDVGDFSGQSVAGAGDVNGDGFDDLIIGAPFADPGNPPLSSAGESYVIFGKSSGFGTSIALSNLNGTNGFRIDGVDASSRAGFSVAGAGDVNGDGLSDLIIGAPKAITSGVRTGESYVVFGRPSGFGASIALSSLNGVTGFRIVGAGLDDQFGISGSSAGDVNGDGFDDLIVGAWEAYPGTPARARAGESYVVFGKSSAFASVLAVSSLNGTNGFRIEGADEIDRSGRSVASAGDVNGDGFDDLIIGAPDGDAGDPIRTSAGESYVLFGKSSGFASSFSLSSLNGTNGFRIDGIDSGDKSGISVSGAGDVNGDGFADLIIGAYNADPGNPLRISAGESYVVFGGNFTGGSETLLGTSAADQLLATRAAAVDVLIGGQGNDILTSDGGSDVLIGGQGNDILAIKNIDFSGHRRIVGGTGLDTLRLDGSGQILNLPAIADNRIVDIEVIDLTGSGDNWLILNHLEVLNLSSSSNTLRVDRNYGDQVPLGSGWSDEGVEVIAGSRYQVYKQGAATLKVQYVEAAPFVVRSQVYYAGSSFAESGVSAALDTNKVLALESGSAQLLNYNNLINSSRGINGLVFDIVGLPGSLTAADFVFQMSPKGAFNEAANPEASWSEAPAPSSVSVSSGATSRVVITWPDDAIANRWLRVTIKANNNTGLATPHVYYLGHLQGETTGASGGRFTVLVDDILLIRGALATTVGVNSTLDLDKSGIVLVQDILDARSNLSLELTQITIQAPS